MDNKELAVRISELLKCKLENIVEVLGIQLNLRDEEEKSAIARVEAISNLNEAWQVFYSAPSPNVLGMALEKIIEFTATSEALKQAVSCLHKTTYLSYEKKINAKWDELSLAEIKNAVTASEIKEIYRNVRYGSPVVETAFEKWNKLSLKQISDARSPDELTKAIWDAPLDSEAMKLGHQKEDDYSLKQAVKAHNLKEARRVTEHINNGKGYDLALEKWNEFSTEEVKEAQTLDEIAKAYSRAHFNSNARKIAIKKNADILRKE